MRINRAALERIINEELVRFIERNMVEQAPGLGSPLDDELPPPQEDPMGPPEEAMPPGEADAEVQDSGDDPSDMALDDELAGEEPEVPGSVASDMQGKTIQDISVEDDSEVIPGAKELVVSFQDEEDKLRIILTPSGNFKFFWKGLHNDIGSSEDVPPEDIEAEEAEDIGQEDDLDLESPPLPTDDGGMEDPELPEV